ncbi:MAG TPA: formylglycine-generating enzyme family protein [Thermoanaerobaculia bacterium]|nr:formylglycine-generating enzyme family protein [Thermoanaerobaculia bacterium]
MPTPWLRRLDFLPPWGAWALGLGGGALAGAALAGAAPGAAGILGFLALLGAAAGLAASGEPIAVVERAGPGVQPPLVDLVEIRGGSFLMGSPESEEGRFDNEGPVHPVRISPFACMRLPVTRRLYAETLGQDPGWPKGEADERPVNNVSWLDAVEFCNRLSERAGLEPCYRIEGERVDWNRTATGDRLLTEAEWEYACRAGTTTRFSFGDDEEQLGGHAWFDDNSNNEPQPVGGKLPNALGLHGMHGNVWEWCWDWFGSYTAERQTDPAGPDDGAGRTLRGGSFIDSPGNLRSAGRGWNPPPVRNGGTGFRCARSPRRQP